VVRKGPRLLGQREREDQAKLEWLRAAAKRGFDAAGNGDYVTLSSDEQIDDFAARVRREAVSKSPIESGPIGPRDHGPYPYDTSRASPLPLQSQ
jgi:Arc/MetJ-type ribon-helix-helix transcriptional regulator